MINRKAVSPTTDNFEPLDAHLVRLTANIIIPSYNRPDMLAKCLVALSQQTRLPERVIVVVRQTDSASRDVLDRPYGDLFVTPVLVGEESNICRLENAGLSIADADVLVFIDDDTVVTPCWMDRLMTWFEHDTTIGALGGPCIPPGEPGKDDKLSVSWYGRVNGSLEYLPSRPVEVDHLPGCNMAFRRNALGCFDDHIHGYCFRFEMEASLRVKNQGWRIIFDPSLRAEHHVVRVKQNWIGKNPASKRDMSRNNTYVLLKHLAGWRRWAFLVYTFLLGDGSPGLLRFLLMLVRRPDRTARWRYMRYSFQGKVLGIRDWLRHRNTSPECGIEK